MQATFTLRRFGPSDLDQVISINRTSLPENYSHSFFMDLHKRYPATFIVAEQEGDIIGYIMCRIETGFTSFSIFGLSKKGHVVSIAVLPAFQRKGVGSALMNEAMKNMHFYKAKECYLEVRVSNTAAIKVYQRLGIQIVRRNKKYYADGEDGYVMAKKLRNKVF